MIFHLAAQSIVKESLDNPYETIDINVMGSLNILEACYELNSKISILMITSDKCYRIDLTEELSLKVMSLEVKTFTVLQKQLPIY